MTEATFVLEWADPEGHLFALVIVDDGDDGCTLELCEYDHNDEMWGTVEELTAFDGIVDFTIPEKFSD